MVKKKKNGMELPFKKNIYYNYSAIHWCKGMSAEGGKELGTAGISDTEKLPMNMIRLLSNYDIWE